MVSEFYTCLLSCHGSSSTCWISYWCFTWNFSCIDELNTSWSRTWCAEWITDWNLGRIFDLFITGDYTCTHPLGSSLGNNIKSLIDSIWDINWCVTGLALGNSFGTSIGDLLCYSVDLALGKCIGTLMGYSFRNYLGRSLESFLGTWTGLLLSTNMSEPLELLGLTLWDKIKGLKVFTMTY